MKLRKTSDSLDVIRESCDYLAVRIDISKDFCRYIDRLGDIDPIFTLEFPKLSFIHESELYGKLHVIRIRDEFGNGIGQVQIARPGAIGFFSEIHLQGNFWFLWGEQFVPEILELFERSIHDSIGIVRLDYAIDTPYESVEIQKLFERISGTKAKRQPHGSPNDTWQSINTRRLKTIYYDKKLDIIKEIDSKGTGKRKFDIVGQGNSRPYQEYYNEHRSITRIEQARKAEALRESADHTLAWYLGGGLRTLALEDLEKKGMCFNLENRMKLTYKKDSEEWKTFSESILQERKEHAKKMFEAYARSLNRFGLLEEAVKGMGTFMETKQMIECMDAAIRYEIEKVLR